MTIVHKPRGRRTNRPPVEELANLYSRHTMKELAEYYNVPITTVRNWISYYRRQEATNEVRA